MPTEDPRAATATAIDPDGSEVVLLVRIWEDKIARGHPELVGHLDGVIETIAKPDHSEPDTLPGRTRFFVTSVPVAGCWWS